MKTILFAFAVLTVFSCGTTTGQRKTEQTVKLTGSVKVFGSEPHTFAGIVDEKGIEYAVYPPEKEEELRRLQGRLIEFTVVFLDNPQGYGSLFLKGGTVTPLKWDIIR